MVAAIMLLSAHILVMLQPLDLLKLRVLLLLHIDGSVVVAFVARSPSMTGIVCVNASKVKERGNYSAWFLKDLPVTSLLHCK
ncbi:hypothetical protein PIB30_113244, partial [Stylosanthes scabra]|nr:hypothetical protein [Stylosanthes scabra]